MTGVRKRQSAFAQAIGIIGAFATVVLTAACGFDAYYVTGTVVIGFLLFPCFYIFEKRKPQAREIVTMAVMCALAIASRVAFIWVPHFKPMAGIDMIAGLAFGPQIGCLIGALSALGSGFLFGIGMWTPWQMLAFGSAGFAFGCVGKFLLHDKARLSPLHLVGLGIGGFLFTVCVLGPILDTSTLFAAFRTVTPETVLMVYGAGLPVNAIHGVATALTLLIAAKPLLGILERIRVKYGLLE